MALYDVTLRVRIRADDFNHAVRIADDMQVQWVNDLGDPQGAEADVQHVDKAAPRGKADA